MLHGSATAARQQLLRPTAVSLPRLVRPVASWCARSEIRAAYREPVLSLARTPLRNHAAQRCAARRAGFPARLFFGHKSQWVFSSGPRINLLVKRVARSSRLLIITVSTNPILEGEE